MSLHKFGIYMICTNGKQCKCGHTCDFCLLGSLPKPGGTSGQLVPKSRCCGTAPIGSAPYPDGHPSRPGDSQHPS